MYEDRENGTGIGVHDDVATTDWTVGFMLSLQNYEAAYTEYMSAFQSNWN